MKIVTNESFVRKKARLGRWTSLLGMGVLFAGLIVSFIYPEWVNVSFGCLLVGFTLANIGSYNLNRWVREPRSDQVLAKVLKGLSNKHHLYNYLSPTPHVLLSPAGLFVLVAKNQDGEIRYENGKWRRDFKWGRFLRFFSEEPLGNPTKELEEEVKGFHRFLERSLPEAEVPIEGVIVFTHPSAELKIAEPDFPAVVAKKLKAHLRELSKGRSLPGSQRKELARVFEAQTR